MWPLGVHFALTADEVAAIRAQPDDEAREVYVTEVIEAHYFDHERDRLVELGKAWHTLHRLLSGGTLDSPPARYPLTHVVIGGEQLYGGPEYIISVKTPGQVRQAAGPLREITKDELRRRYFALDKDFYDPPSESGWEYVWWHFEDLRAFWERALDGGYHVVFTGDT